MTASERRRERALDLARASDRPYFRGLRRRTKCVRIFAELVPQFTDRIVVQALDRDFESDPESNLTR
jgi:hypothetical protein